MIMVLEITVHCSGFQRDLQISLAMDGTPRVGESVEFAGVDDYNSFTVDAVVWEPRGESYGPLLFLAAIALDSEEQVLEEVEALTKAGWKVTRVFPQPSDAAPSTA